MLSANLQNIKAAFLGGFKRHLKLFMAFFEGLTFTIGLGLDTACNATTFGHLFLPPDGA